MADKPLLVVGYAADTKDNRHAKPYPPSPNPPVQMAFQQAKFDWQLTLVLRCATPKVRRYPKTHFTLSIGIDYGNV